MFHGHLDYFQKAPLGGRPNTKPGDHVTPNAYNHWFILFYHMWGLTWIEIHWNGIWLRAWSHMTSHYRTLEDPWLHSMIFGGDLGRPFRAFLWALTISWSQLLACVWSGFKLKSPSPYPLNHQLGSSNCIFLSRSKSWQQQKKIVKKWYLWVGWD